MITLQGLWLNQKGHTLYLTSTTVEQLKKWFDDGNITADIWKRDKEEGYQRAPDTKRFKEIANYLEGNLQIEQTLLPNSLILNIRDTGCVDFEPLEEYKGVKTIEVGKILIHDEALPFSEVDGQHRIGGLIQAYKEQKGKQGGDFEQIKSYPVPLTIIEGLDRPSEAIQFVVINNKQKKVKPDLVLQILYKRYRDKGEQLDFFLKGKTWRLWAVEICGQLNLNPDSPWCDKIAAPSDKRKGRLISEQNFVNSLETVYSKIDRDTVRTYLPQYWRAISNVWQECVGDNAVKYSLQKSNGTSVFHWIFPFVYFKSVSLGSAKLKELINTLKPLRKKYGPSFWQRGGEAKKYTSKGAQRELVDNMIAAVSFYHGKEIRLEKLPKGLEGTKEEKTWAKAANLIPLRLYQLFKQDKVNGVNEGATGAYILYSFTKQQFYVGRSHKADLRARLQNHLQNKEDGFHIFNHRLCTEPKEAHDLECALYHLLPKHLLMNKEHPRR
ncbi:MAG: DGQHR domain-containing protein [Chloroflexi bacterium]|nr:DGQHR domain-containing protein [Chloroflexota bacterium]